VTDGTFPGVAHVVSWQQAIGPGT